MGRNLYRLFQRFLAPKTGPYRLGRWCTGPRNWEAKVDNENGDHGYTPSTRRAKATKKTEDEEDGPWSRPTLATVMGV